MPFGFKKKKKGWDATAQLSNLTLPNMSWNVPGTTQPHSPHNTRPLSPARQNTYVSPQQQTGVRTEVCIALHDYNARSHDELPFKTGDRLLILSKMKEGWWWARQEQSVREGYIPSNYVALENSTVHTGWFHGEISRADAERNLTMPSCARGTYLIRLRPAEPGSYALSVLDDNDVKGRHVLHYKIHRTLDGYFGISGGNIFKTLQDLIQYYSGT